MMNYERMHHHERMNSTIVHCPASLIVCPSSYYCSCLAPSLYYYHRSCCWNRHERVGWPFAILHIYLPLCDDLLSILCWQSFKFVYVRWILYRYQMFTYGRYALLLIQLAVVNKYSLPHYLQERLYTYVRTLPWSNCIPPFNNVSFLPALLQLVPRKCWLAALGMKKVHHSNRIEQKRSYRLKSCRM